MSILSLILLLLIEVGDFVVTDAARLPTRRISARDS
jgi:hypothetical protein